MRKEELIEQLVEKIKLHYKPEKVILFGSYAWGNPKEHSDLDMLIIKETNKSEIERMIEVSKLLIPREIAIDIIVKTPKEIKERLEIKDTFIIEILTKGRAIYERKAG